MAVLASVLGMTTDAGSGSSQTTGGATSAIDACGTATSRLIAINADQDVLIRFGSTTGATAATATDFRIPQNSTFIFSVNQATRYFTLYNNSGSTVNYYWCHLSQF